MMKLITIAYAVSVNVVLFTVMYFRFDLAVAAIAGYCVCRFAGQLDLWALQERQIKHTKASDPQYSKCPY
jgi:hypothetical protein